MYATTAGIAAKSPCAVANNASAIPGATIAKLVFLDTAIDWNEFIIPHTVPNNPIKGAVDPIVARKVKDKVSFWYYKEEILLAVDSFNDPYSYMIGKRLIEEKKSPKKEILRDINFDFKETLNLKWEFSVENLKA